MNIEETNKIIFMDLKKTLRKLSLFLKVAKFASFTGLGNVVTKNSHIFWNIMHLFLSKNFQ